MLREKQLDTSHGVYGYTPVVGCSSSIGKPRAGTTGAWRAGSIMVGCLLLGRSAGNTCERSIVNQQPGPSGLPGADAPALGARNARGPT